MSASDLSPHRTRRKTAYMRFTPPRASRLSQRAATSRGRDSGSFPLARCDCGCAFVFDERCSKLRKSQDCRRLCPGCAFTVIPIARLRAAGSAMQFVPPSPPPHCLRFCRSRLLPRARQARTSRASGQNHNALCVRCSGLWACEPSLDSRRLKLRKGLVRKRALRETFSSNRNNLLQSENFTNR
jgi:hypothetical protein